MAEITIVVLAKDPSYEVTREKIELIKSTLAEMFPTAPYGIETKQSEHPFYVTTGDEFDSIVCPKCGEQLNRFFDENEEYEEWWNDTFIDLVIYTDVPKLDEEFEMPCCGESITLNDIDLDGSAYLTRFSLSIRDPDDGISLTAEQLCKLESITGISLRHMTVINS